MKQPTTEQLYEIKCNVLAQELSEAYNKITELTWVIQEQRKELDDVSQNTTDA